MRGRQTRPAPGVQSRSPGGAIMPPHMVITGGVGGLKLSGGTSATPAGNVSIDTPEYGYSDDLREVWIRFHVNPPDPVGTFKGVHVFYELPDQSSSPSAKLDGS